MLTFGGPRFQYSGLISFWQRGLATGAKLLFRVRRNLRLPREKALADGSYYGVHPVQVRPQATAAHREPQTCRTGMGGAVQLRAKPNAQL